MITFVGAGPGAEDLITVRGQRLLKEADIVIYAGSLVNPGLLKLCKEKCEIYNSAKMTLEEVLEVMVKGHGDGKEIESRAGSKGGAAGRPTIQEAAAISLNETIRPAGAAVRCLTKRIVWARAGRSRDCPTW